MQKSEIYTTTSDFQTSVRIKIYEGEDTEYIENNYYYDEYEHGNIENGFAGVPKIEVTFHLIKQSFTCGFEGPKDWFHGKKGC